MMMSSTSRFIELFQQRMHSHQLLLRRIDRASLHLTCRILSSGVSPAPGVRRSWVLHRVIVCLPVVCDASQHDLWTGQLQSETASARPRASSRSDDGHARFSTVQELEGRSVERRVGVRAERGPILVTETLHLTSCGGQSGRKKRTHRLPTSMGRGGSPDVARLRYTHRSRRSPRGSRGADPGLS